MILGLVNPIRMASNTSALSAIGNRQKFIMKNRQKYDKRATARKQSIRQALTGIKEKAGCYFCPEDCGLVMRV